MSKPVSPLTIGAFLAGGLALLISGLLLFGGTEFFRPKLLSVVFFDSSLNGLNVGAPVKVQGVQVGTVKSIVLELDQHKNRLSKPVVLEIDPAALVDPNGRHLDVRLSADERRATIARMVAAGLRARLELQSFLTGLLYVDLNFYPSYPAIPNTQDYQDLPEIPALPTAVDEIKASVEDLIAKLRHMPLEAIANNLAATMGEVRTIVASEETRRTRQELAETMTQASRLLAELNRQLPSLLTDVRQAVRQADQSLVSAGKAFDEAGQIARNADLTVRETTTMVHDLRAETKPVLAAAEASLVKAGETLEQARIAVENIATATDADSNLQDTLMELRDAARSIRVLTDYLERHPDSLIYGKSQ